MSNERYIINLDENHTLLQAQGISYGRQFKHGNFYMSVSGCETQEKADNYVLKEIERKGWKLREKWWQLWRPENFLPDRD